MAVRYVLPLSATPPQVKNLAVDMALYHLYSRRSVAPQVRRQKYEAAVAFLKQVAAGQARVEGGAAAVGEAREEREALGGRSRREGQHDQADRKIDVHLSSCYF